MKQLSITLAIFTICCHAYAQGGTIVGFSVSPENPVEGDEVKVYADLSFSSGGCDLDFIAYPLNGTTINATAHHCVGLLTVICNTTDTFELGQLSAGNYTFDMTLTSGAGGPGCTPGIVADDNDQFQFTVSPSVGIDEVLILEDHVYPNPISDVLNFKRPFSETAFIRDMNGKRIMEIPAGSNQADLSALAKGIYTLQVGNRTLKLIKTD